MALALILQMQMEPNGLRVRYDLGKNRYLRWQVGQGRRSTRSGLPAIASVLERSELVGPVPQSALGRGELMIPRRVLSRAQDLDSIQLISYRQADGTGPAISSVARLPAPSVLNGADRESPLALPPPAGFSHQETRASAELTRGQGVQTIKQPYALPYALEYTPRLIGSRHSDIKAKDKEHGMSTISLSAHSTVSNSQHSPAVRSIAFALRERRYSEPLFLEAIAGALPTLIPMLAPAVSSLIAGVAPALGQIAGQFIQQLTPAAPQAPAQPVNPPAATRPSSPAQTPASTQTPRTRQTPATQVSPSGAGAVPTGTRQTVAQIGQLAEQVLSALGPASERVLTPENMRQIMQLIQAGQASAQSLGLSRRFSQGQSGQHYSHAQVAPALLAALPALMPLLRQVLSPQTVQSIIQAPERMTGQIINGISDFARLGLQADQQLNEHLINFLPEEPTALYGLLSGLSLSLNRRYTRQYRRVSQVQLSLNALPTQMVFGREQVLMLQGAPWQFSLNVQTPKTITKAKLQVQIKHADSLKVVYDELLPAGSVSSGALEVMPEIPEHITQSLEAGSDYIAIFTLLWKNKRNQLRGAPIQQTLSVMGAYLFDHVEESGDLIALSDRTRFADYWHQVCDIEFDDQTRRADIQTRYFMTLSTTEPSHARMDSAIRKQSHGARSTLQVRSGFEYSLTQLNHLLQRLDSGGMALTSEQLQALQTNDFIDRFQQAAQHRGQFRGRPGHRAQLWVCPSFKLQTLVLVKASSVGSQGAVQALTEASVNFPMPVMCHFIGVSYE